MIEGGVVAVPAQAAGGVQAAIGADELAHGLLLVRSSAIKLARLHVAIERKDRRLVLETMDDLAALDRRIEKLVEAIPTSDSDVEVLQAELADQKMTLAREKLAFGAGILRGEPRPSSTGLSTILNQEPGAATVIEREVPALPQAPSFVEDGIVEEWMAADEETDVRLWPRLLGVACLLIIAVSLAAVTFTSAGRDYARSALIAAGA